MSRFFWTVVLGLALFFGIVWYFDLMPGAPANDGRSRGAKTSAASVDLGGPLYPPAPAVKARSGDEAGAPRIDSIIIGGQLAVTDKVELSADTDGTVLFIGEEVPDGIVAAAGLAPFMADPFRFAAVDLGRTRGGVEQVLYKFYRRLEEGMQVPQDRIVAMLNPNRAIAELAIRAAKYEAAVSDLHI